jgi:histidinol dehydrogenase
MSFGTRTERLPCVGEHRLEREAGRLVYPVISRRSGGLSLGINLFPDAKRCSFDCPYCEVFPLAAGLPPFSLAALEIELNLFLESGYASGWKGVPVRDLCISGNGEPTLSDSLGAALDLCSRARRAHPEVLGGAALVLITNSTGFLVPETSALLSRYAKEEGLVVWAKLDGGNEKLHRLMTGSSIELERITRGIEDFARRTPIVVQTMLCEVHGRGPSKSDVADYSALLNRLTQSGALVDEVHLYTFARPTPAGGCASLSAEGLRGIACSVHAATGLAVRAFSASRELQW